MDKCKNYHARDVGVYTAFIYAGALLSQALRDNPQTLETWGGHIGFVHYVAEHAADIAEWLDTRNDFHPGVMAYELLEPMGEWLCDVPVHHTREYVLKHFQIEYISWLAAAELERN